MQKFLAASLLSPALLLAQEATHRDASYAHTNDLAAAAQRATARGEVLDGKLGVGLVSQYFFRGIQQENQGLIFQPWLELGADLWQSDDEQQSLRLVFGQWNSLHNGPTAPAGNVWHESRFYAGVEGQLSERFYAGARLNLYSNPNDAGGAGLNNITEWQFSARFDDAGLISDDFSLQPTATIAIEADGQRDLGSDEGVYLELGINPSWQIGEVEGGAVTLTAPTRLGFGLDDYYERVGGGNDEFFGFLQTGAVVDAPLSFLPEGMGPWQGFAAAHLIVLGDNNEARNGGDTADVFFEIGMTTTF